MKKLEFEKTESISGGSAMCFFAAPIWAAEQLTHVTVFGTALIRACWNS